MSDEDKVVVSRKPRVKAGATSDAAAAPADATKPATTAAASVASPAVPAVAAPSTHTDPATSEPAAPRRRAAGQALATLDDEHDVNGAGNAAASSTADSVRVADTDTYDYDTMTFDGFLTLLTRQTKAERQEEKKRVRQQQSTLIAARQVEERFFDGNKAYTYNTMLTAAIAEIRRRRGTGKGPDGERPKCPMPVLERAGAKVTALSNLVKICHALNRNAEDIKDYIEKQLVCRSSIDYNNALIIRIVNLRVSQMEGILGRYVEECCLCTECNTINTTLERDSATRLQKLTCLSCGASRNLQNQAAAYQANTQRRAAMRNKTL